MPKVVYDLDTRLVKTIEFCTIKRITGAKLQNYLVDALNRFIIPFNDVTPLVECIKQYHQINHCVSRFNQLVETHQLGKINDTVRLLLIKAVYLEYTKQRVV